MDKRYCPSCDYPLFIVDGQIVTDNHVVRSCPNCLQELHIVDGKDEIEIVTNYEQ